MASAGSSVQPDPQDVQEVPDRRNERLAPLAFQEVDLHVDNENEQPAQAPQANPDHVNEQSPADVAQADDSNRIQPAPAAQTPPASPLDPAHDAARHLQGEHGSGPGEKFHSLTQIWRDLLVSDKGVSAVTILHSYGYFISILMTLWGWNEFLEFGRKSTLVMQIIIQLVGFSVSALGVNACYTKKPSRLSLFFVYQLIHTILVFFSLYYMFRTSRKELFPDFVAEPYYNMRLVDQPFGMDSRLKDLAAQPAYEVSLLYFRAVYMLLVTNVFNIYTLYSVGKKLWNQHQQASPNAQNPQDVEMRVRNAENNNQHQQASPNAQNPQNVEMQVRNDENNRPDELRNEQNDEPRNEQNDEPRNEQNDGLGNDANLEAAQANQPNTNNNKEMTFFGKVGLLFGCEPPKSNDNGQNGENGENGNVEDENVAVENV